MRLKLYRAVLCWGTLLMLIQSWPLWVGRSEVAQVPWFTGILALPPLAEAIGIGFVSLGLFCAGCGLWPRVSLGVATVCLIGFVLFDQGRFQPWIYQFLAIGFVLSVAPGASGLVFARAYVVGLYIHSGLSKLDISFTQELGSIFLETLGRLIGFVPQQWSSADRTLAILAMPLAEIAIGLGLMSRSFQTVALVGSVGLHMTLIAILGPWGLSHSPNVLFWNGLILVGNLILMTESRSWDWSGLRNWRYVPVWFLLVVISLFPLLEPWGLFDTWPSHALYASHAERTEFFVDADDVEQLPDVIRRHLESQTNPNWLRLDLTNLSRDQRGTPLYPQGRSSNGVVEDLAIRYGGPHPVRVLQWGRADRWTGRRSRVELIGREAIRHHGDIYWFNAHPSRGRPDAAAPG